MNKELNPIEQLFKQNKGYLHTACLDKNRAMYYALQELIAQKHVVKIKVGFYKHLELVQENEAMEVSKMYPQAVVCLESAWFQYNLTTHIPSTYHLAFSNKTKVKLEDYPPVKAYYWSERLQQLEVIELDGIKTYSLEKSVCDAIKFRNKIGLDTMKTILKNYLKRKDKDLSKLFRVAKVMKMEILLREYLTLIQ